MGRPLVSVRLQQNQAGHHAAQQASYFGIVTCPVIILLIALCLRSKKKKEDNPAGHAATLSNGYSGGTRLKIVVDATGTPDITSPSSPVMKTITSPMRNFEGKRTGTPSTLRREEIRKRSESKARSRTMPISLAQAPPPPATGTRVQIYNWLVEQHKHSLLQTAYGADVEFNFDDDLDGANQYDSDTAGGDDQVVIRSKKTSRANISSNAPRSHTSLHRSNSLALDLTLFEVDAEDQDTSLSFMHNAPFAKSMDASMFVRASYENVVPMRGGGDLPALQPRDSRYRTSASTLGSPPSDASFDSDDLEEPGPYHLKSKKQAAYENVQPTTNDDPVIQLQNIDAASTGPPAAAATTTQQYENVPAARVTYQNVDIEPAVGPGQELSPGDVPGNAEQLASRCYENVPPSSTASPTKHAAGGVQADDGNGVKPSGSWYEQHKLTDQAEIPQAQNFTAVKEDKSPRTRRAAAGDGTILAEGGTLTSNDSDENTPLATMTGPTGAALDSAATTIRGSTAGKNSSSGRSTGTTLGASSYKHSSSNSASTTMSGPYATLKREDFPKRTLPEENELDDDYNHLDKGARNADALSQNSGDTVPYGRIHVADADDYDTIDQLNADAGSAGEETGHDYDELDRQLREEIILANSTIDLSMASTSELADTESDSPILNVRAQSPRHRPSSASSQLGRSRQRPSSASSQHGRASQALLSAAASAAGDSGLEEFTPYSTLSKSSRTDDDRGDIFPGRHSGTSSEVTSCRSSQNWQHTPGTNHRRPASSHHQPPVATYGGRDDLLLPDVPHSPRPRLANRTPSESSSGVQTTIRESPSSSVQLSRGGSQVAMPEVPPGDDRPTHLRASSSGVSRAESDSELQHQPHVQIDDIILDNLEVGYDPAHLQKNFILGPTQPMLMSRKLMTTSILQEHDVVSMIDGGEDADLLKTYF